MIIAGIVSHPVLIDGHAVEASKRAVNMSRWEANLRFIKNPSGFIKNNLFLINDMCLGELTESL